jgi:hypothetical protein
MPHAGERLDAAPHEHNGKTTATGTKFTVPVSAVLSSVDPPGLPD